MAQWERTHLPMQENLQEMQVQSLGQEDPLEKEMATHSSVLAWRTPRTEANHVVDHALITWLIRH